jgi:hypothetical protein
MADATPYRRPFHARVQTVLLSIDAEAFAASACYFGGGTRSVLALNEYRESKDIDFLCADRDGYRALRTTVVERGLQGLFGKPVILRRDPLIAMDGIRAVIDVAGEPLKFEIVLEARLKALEADAVRCNGLAQLSQEFAFAEKFLANADRGLDASTLARDVVDLAYMAEHWGMEPARSGLLLAEGAYGKDVQDKLILAVGRMQSDRGWRQRCVRGLSLDQPKVLRSGLEKLQATHWRKVPAQQSKPL